MGKVHVVKTNSFGGDGGSPFDDYPEAGNQIESIREIMIRAVKRVDCLKIKYLLSSGKTAEFVHGAKPGGSVISLADNERIVAVKGRSGARIDRLEFVSNKKTYGPYGGSGGGAFTFVAEIRAFHGKSASELNRLGFYAVVRQSDFYGGEGKEFADPVPVPGQSAIEQITFYTGVYSRRRIVHGIKTKYRVNDKDVFHVHGKEIGDSQTINLETGEKIKLITVYVGTISFGRATRVIGLTVNTTRGISHNIGRDGNKKFIVDGEISGFVGRSSEYLTAIGFYTTPMVQLTEG